MSETEWSTITPTKSGDTEETIEFEIEGQADEEQQPQQEEAPQVEVETKQEEQAPQAEVETQQEEKAPTKNEEEKAVEGVETSGAQKRIRQLVQQKKDREAQIEELLAKQKDMQTQLQQREEEYHKLLNTNVESNERQVTERIELSKAAYREALESGEADRILAAQEALTNAQQDNYKLNEFRAEAESFQPIKFEEEELITTAQPMTNPTLAQEKAQQWAAENDWFNSDRVMTAAALEIDSQLQEEGFDPADDDYYAEVNSRMAQAFPYKFRKAAEEAAPENPVPQESSTPAQVVAGASHTSAAPSNKKVKLTQEDVRLAEKWGISLEQYAAEKLKVEKAGDGEYTTINR